MRFAAIKSAICRWLLKVFFQTSPEQEFREKVVAEVLSHFTELQEAPQPFKADVASGLQFKADLTVLDKNGNPK